MSFLPVAFGAPLILLGLLALPVIWWLLRLTPPRPRTETFPPTRILERLSKPEETPAQSPWWLTLLRLALAALVILALAQPIWRPAEATLGAGDGPVLIVLDNSWSSGPDWDVRRETAERLIGEAEGLSLPIVLVPTVGADAASVAPADASTARERLGAIEARPVPAESEALADRLAALDEPFSQVAWLTGGVADPGSAELAARLAAIAPDGFVYAPRDARLVAIAGVENSPEAMIVRLARPTADAAEPVTLEAYDAKSRPLGRTDVVLAAGKTVAEGRIDLPVELRNDIARVEIVRADHAGGVALLDERFRRRTVGLVSGAKADNAQPLLSPLYYIRRALGPFAQVRTAASANVSEALPELIEAGASVIVLADIGTLPDEPRAALEAWIEEGGLLVRFAGPRLAAAEDDTLVPTRLRGGGRQLGGALTWEEPQTLAAFTPNSPFAGLEVPDDVSVSRQVLAEPGIELADRTWASLADGTPLVTAAGRGRGTVVLFHVTADASWSNLALSGTFVDMLRRIVAASSGSLSAERTAAGDGATALPPLRTLDGRGRLSSPPADAEPLAVGAGTTNVVSLANPPGLYGSNDAFTALNLLDDEATLAPIETAGFTAVPYRDEAPLDLKPWLLAAALLLLLVDCLVVLWMAGALARTRRAAAAASVLVLALGFAPDPAAAQDSSLPPELAATLKTRFAYVVTGNNEIDALSRKGLNGLTQFVASRTALEPGEPIAVDVASDELAFYPLLYWPVDAATPVPSPEAMARVDTFMKQGGTVLFDTRDASLGLAGAVSPATQRLREILAGLDVPALEPVPENHVLTRAFYLLDSFPGRYSSGQLWVEALPDETESTNRPARAGDGVSSIMITSNDFAGAWALEASGRFSLPTVPADPLQRNYAFRVGTNIAMYTLTGNYKADQVHIPALLERLGQ